MTRTRLAAAVAGAILTAAVALTGCSAKDEGASASGGAPAASTEQDSGQAPDQAPEKAAEPNADGSARDKSAPDAKTTPGGAAQPSVTRAIIKNGSLTVETADVDGQRQKAVGIATALQGQIASEDTGSEDNGTITRANLVLRVPTASYETAIQRLGALGKRTQIHQESTDVTEQVVDVDSRITTQRASLGRMRTLLAKATTIGEIVSVETELTRREADLESLLAKQKSLAGQTELATLALTLTAPAKTVVVEDTDDDRGFLAGLAGGWNAFTAVMSGLATVLGALLPFLIVLALIGLPAWRVLRRYRRRPPATVES